MSQLTRFAIFDAFLELYWQVVVYFFKMRMQTGLVIDWKANLVIKSFVEMYNVRRQQLGLGSNLALLAIR